MLRNHDMRHRMALAARASAGALLTDAGFGEACALDDEAVGHLRTRLGGTRLAGWTWGELLAVFFLANRVVWPPDIVDEWPALRCARWFVLQSVHPGYRRGATACLLLLHTSIVQVQEAVHVRGQPASRFLTAAFVCEHAWLRAKTRWPDEFSELPPNCNPLRAVLDALTQSCQRLGFLTEGGDLRLACELLAVVREEWGLCARDEPEYAWDWLTRPQAAHPPADVPEPPPEWGDRVTLTSTLTRRAYQKRLYWRRKAESLEAEGKLEEAAEARQKLAEATAERHASRFRENNPGYELETHLALDRKPRRAARGREKLLGE